MSAPPIGIDAQGLGEGGQPTLKWDGAKLGNVDVGTEGQENEQAKKLSLALVTSILILPNLYMPALAQRLVKSPVQTGCSRMYIKVGGRHACPHSTCEITCQFAIVKDIRCLTCIYSIFLQHAFWWRHDSQQKVPLRWRFCICFSPFLSLFFYLGRTHRNTRYIILHPV